MNKTEFDFFCSAVSEMYGNAQDVPVEKKYIAHLSMGKSVAMVLDTSQISELRVLLLKARLRMSKRKMLESLIEQQKDSFYLN